MVPWCHRTYEQYPVASPKDSSCFPKMIIVTVVMITIVGLQEATANKLSTAAQEASLPHHIGQVSNSIIIVIVIITKISLILIVIIMSSAGVSTSQSYNSANDELEFDLYDYRGSREW